MIQPPDSPKKTKQVTWIDGASTSKVNGTGLRDPCLATNSPPSMLLEELRTKWLKRKRKQRNVKNQVKNMPKKRRKSFQLVSSDDSSESEYSTSSSQDTNFNPSSDGWDSSEEEKCTPDAKWDEFLAKLLQNHATPGKTSTQKVGSQRRPDVPRNSPSQASDSDSD